MIICMGECVCACVFVSQQQNVNMEIVVYFVFFPSAASSLYILLSILWYSYYFIHWFSVVCGVVFIIFFFAFTPRFESCARQSILCAACMCCVCALVVVVFCTTPSRVVLCFVFFLDRCRCRWPLLELPNIRFIIVLKVCFV